MGLQRYKAKRNFQATPEPPGKVKPRKRGSLSFVVQKHDATRLHYDFRLEVDGVLASWAVPKGVPTTRGERRLAMHVEDHPLDYGAFEGIIPDGNYGGGTVMLWDRGSWEPLGGKPADDIKAGKLHFALHGEKLEGEWTLVRMGARSRSAGKDEWLLIKSGDDINPVSAAADRSVETGRTMAQIARQRTRTWLSNGSGGRASPGAPSAERLSAKSRIAAAARRAVPPETASPPVPGRRPPEKPAFHEPMNARLVEHLSPEHTLIELKHDGYRALAIKEGASVKLYSRSQREITREFPAIADAVRRFPARQAVIDGELVALNEQGYGSFQLLQNRERIRGEETIVFYVFDILHLNGRSTRDLPLTQRRALAEPLVAGAGEPLRFSPALNGSPQVVLAEVRKLGLEGIVAKKPESAYEVGRRSGAWIKLKCVNEQEFVIGGYTPPKGSREFFGALLVGYYMAGRLMFSSKVGTGYSQNLLRELHRKFQPLRQQKCPFLNLPTRRSGKFGQGVSAAEMKRCTWLRPMLVAQVRFSGWTTDRGLRHPVFLGLREDKRAHDVRPEYPES